MTLYVLFALEPVVKDGVPPLGSAPFTLFQIVSVAILSLLVIRDLYTSFARSSGRWFRVFRMCVLVAAAAAIANPLLPQAVATFLGIDRAADLVLYLSVLCFLWVAFFLYSCHLRVQRQVTQLTRHIAIQEATRTNDSNLK